MPNPSSRLSLSRMARSQRTFYRLASIALVAGALYWAQSIFVPISLAVLLAFALTPPAEWLERRGLGRVPASLLVSVAALALLGGLGWVAGTQVRQLAAELPRYGANVKEKVEPLRHLLETLERIGNFSLAPPAAPPADPAAPAATPPLPVTVVRPSGTEALGWLPSVALPAAHALASFLLVTVLTIFLLSQRESVRDRFLALAGRRQLTATTRAMEDAGRRVSHYLLLQSATNASMGLVAAVGLLLIGVPYAALWGLLTAALRFVPYIGVWVSALFPVALAVAVFPGWGPALLVLAVYGVTDLLLSNVVEPLLFGHGTGVSSLALLIAAAFWAFLWGPVGLLLAIPMTVCLVVVGEHVPSLGFLRTLLGDEPQVDPAARYFHRILSREFDQAAMLVEEQAATRSLLDLYDGVILSALAQAKTERDRGDLNPTEERRFSAATRDVLDGVLAELRADAGAAVKPAHPPARVIGCSTKGETDKLALTMLRDVARQAGCEVEIVPAARLVEEVRAAAGRSEEIVACIAAVSPGGLAQVGGLCKQLRGRVPGVKVLVGRWGTSADRSETEKFLRSAGAANVTWTLRETLAEIAPEAAAPEEPKAAAETPAGPGRITVPA
ncbi:MAG TPA: AI-2E family transporter [Urbifossiella sp.]|nr:AI-2E family transporter [Urbifossiella sp.]